MPGPPPRAYGAIRPCITERPFTQTLRRLSELNERRIGLHLQVWTYKSLAAEVFWDNEKRIREGYPIQATGVVSITSPIGNLLVTSIG